MTIAPAAVPAPESGPGVVLRAIWFIVAGWWLGQIALVVGWFLTVIVITLPIGLYILNRLPTIITLRPPTQEWKVQQAPDGTSVLSAAGPPQRNLLLRALYFVLIGWWFSFIWLEVAYLCAATIVLLPLSFWMFAKSAFVISLRRT